LQVAPFEQRASDIATSKRVGTVGLLKYLQMPLRFMEFSTAIIAKVPNATELARCIEVWEK
jgi:hypothetical protein